MDTYPPDLGKIVLAGYINADPPGEPQFALSANGSGYAASIQQAGGSVIVDNLGGINMVASSTAFVGVDSFANITLDTGVTSGVILLQTNGGGNDVDIQNAGTIAFDAVGAGALINVQSINGAPYVPGAGSYSGLAVCAGDGVSTTWYINVTADVPGLTANSVVQVTLQVPDGSSQNWIVDATPIAVGGSANRYIRINFASAVNAADTTVAWFVAALDVVPSEAGTVGP